MTLAIVTLVLFALLLGRMPVAFAMAIAGLIGLTSQMGWGVAISILERLVFESTSAFILVAIPLFILMAELLTAGDITRRTVIACQAWIGHVKGGLAFATVGAAVLLAALVGSSTASSATMATSAYPEMKKFKYDDRLSTAVVSVGGTLAILIPPSIVLIFYGVLTETSIGNLFLAGVLPGLLTAAGFVVTIMIRSRRHGMAPPAEQFELRRAVRSSVGIWPVMLLIFGMMGAIYSGIASPTEAAALGASGALILALTQREMNRSKFFEAFSRAVQTTVMIVTIIYCSHIFSGYLVFTRVTPEIIETVQQSGLPPSVILFIVLVLILFLGFFLDQIAIMGLTLPLVFPLMMALGYDALWFGIVITKTVEIGLLTPPLGLNVYVTASRTGVPLNTVFRGVMPFLLAELVVLALLVFFPDITLWLPEQVGF
ncbi:MAG: TRAP transporter large permease [Alphaproteobacteria bacterium]|nr:TRAP transporter large permease [Alphaproteobacteria bacterium]MDX5369460.1 TRAP transporter large permease [Alphaproteobacteria bacterium]MDX5464138.1 TRAP transporter large permease [Alphaproteobacteria bacterium]